MKELIINYDEDSERAKIPINITSFTLPKTLLNLPFLFLEKNKVLI